MKEAATIPPTVHVTGGGLILNEIATIFTEPISLENLTESGTISVGLVLNPASLKLTEKNKFQINYIISKKASLL